MRVLKFLILFVACLISGCSTVNGLRLPEDRGGVSKTAQKLEEKQTSQELTVAIVPFSEKRGDLKSYGSVYQYLIPLVPYGTMRYERPDEAKMFNKQNEFEFNMGENLLKVLVESIKKSAAFSNVIVTPTPLESGADVILSGDIHSTLYEGKTYSYGISFAGPVLWCFGLPAGSSHKKLNITLYLKKMDTQELLWTYTINKENTVIQGLYHNWGKEVNSFVSLMSEGTKEAVKDMQRDLANLKIEKLKVVEPEIANPQEQKTVLEETPPNKESEPAPALELPSEAK